jgi:hypothetical protein
MPPDNLTPQMAEDKWNGQKRSEPSVEFGGLVFTALAISRQAAFSNGS